MYVYSSRSPHVTHLSDFRSSSERRSPEKRSTITLSILQIYQRCSLIISEPRDELTRNVGPQDSIFTAVLHVSDSDKIFRYTDEGTFPSPLLPCSSFRSLHCIDGTLTRCDDDRRDVRTLSLDGRFSRFAFLSSDSAKRRWVC